MDVRTDIRRTRSILLLTALVGLVASFAAAPAAADPPASITLTGTIRDFLRSHPDFEDHFGTQPETGIVSETLGPDSKPVYAHPGGSTATTTGQANFDQWYRDTPGVNQTTSHDIQLDLVPASSPPRYRYSSNSFFPIDGQLWGNEGEVHNYWFTYEVHNTFTYQGGETLSFTGDDDVWVFVNGSLIVDLGGVHPAASATVDLDAIASQIGIVPGNSYSFDAFFAERRTTDSNFTMETSIQLDPQLSIADRIVNEGSTGGRSAAPRTPDAPARFVLSLSAPSGDPVRVDYATADGTAVAGADYDSTAGRLTFLPGITRRTISVPIVPDNSDEPNQTFTVELSNPHGALIDDGTAVGTIKDDDDPPNVSVGDTSLREGRTHPIPIFLSSESGKVVRVSYATVDGPVYPPAEAPGDYAPRSGTVTFQPGVVTRYVNVSTVQDNAQEPPEQFSLNISAPLNATISDPSGTATIEDDDPD